MHYIYTLFISLSLIIISGCTGVKPDIDQPISASTGVRPQHIFVLGDSLSAGYQLPLEQSYPSVLSSNLQKLGHQVTIINAGKSGDTSAGLLARLERIIADAQSGDIALIVIGGNDGLQGLSTKDLEQNIYTIVTTLESRDIYTIIGGMQIPTNLGNDYRQDFASLYPRIASKTSSILIPFVLSGVAGDPSLNLSDGIHPNQSGQIIVANTVMPYILPLLSK